MKKYFLNAPYLIKLIMVNIYGFFIHRKRYNKDFYQNLKYYNSVDKNEIFSFNYEKFNKQILKNQFFDRGVKNIDQYPVINKKIIKDHYNEIINYKEVYDYLHTSGTTGAGLKFPVSKNFINQQWAVFWKFRNIHKITLETWCANIISQTMFQAEQSKPPFWLKSYSTHQLLLSMYHINHNTVKSYIDAIKVNKIYWLHAYPSVLNHFANLIKENNLLAEAKEMNLKIITTSSEKLFDYQKQNIKDIFYCDIKELYGLTEGVVNIFECENGTLHIDESYSYVELLPIEKSVNEYKIVGTSYHNNAFPLVRYDTGDTCILYEKGFICKCGRKSRIIKEILGRDDDYLILSNGNKIGRISSIFKILLSVKEAQVFQNEIGYAQFRIIRDSRYSNKDEEKLKEQIKEKLGKDFRFEIIYLDRIERTKNGKLKFVINTLDENYDIKN